MRSRAGPVRSDRTFIVVALAVPIAVHLAIAALWAVSGSAKVPVLSLLVDAAGLPLFLGVLGVRRLNSGVVGGWRVTTPVLALSLLLGIASGYLTWGSWGGDMLHPDGETVALFWGEAILGAVIVLVIVGVGALRKALFKPLA